MTASATTARPPVETSPMLVGIALGIVYVVWGSTYLAIRIMVEEMPPLLAPDSASWWPVPSWPDC